MSSSPNTPQANAPLDHDAIPTDLPKVGTGTVAVIAFVIVAVLGGLFLLGYLPYRERTARLAREAAEGGDAKPVVQVSVVKRSQAESDLSLPGDARANQSTAIYPRANGYLKKLLVDIGDPVKEGQLLAEIDTPEVDAQLAQARAVVVQAQANQGKAQNDFDLAQGTLDRYAGFAKTGGVTQQQLDEKQSAFAQAKAALAAAKGVVSGGEADVKRLEALSSWQRVTAPFTGTITGRNFDVGALITPGSTGRELLKIEQTDVLRVYASVPQQYAMFIRKDMPAAFMARGGPARAFAGRVARTAGAIDPQTRTLRIEIEVPNKEGLLYAGMYGQVKLKVKQDKPPVRVPTSALVYNAKGTRVAVVSAGKVAFRDIQPGRDFGQEMEVTACLDGGEWVIANPGERLTDGLEVEVAGVPSTTAAEPRKAEAPAAAPALTKAEESPR